MNNYKKEINNLIIYSSNQKDITIEKPLFLSENKGYFDEDII